MQLFTLFLFFSTFSSQAFSQDITGPIARSMGGAGRAATSPTEVGNLNPAGLAYLHKYYLSGFAITQAGIPQLDNRQMGITLSDGSPGVMLPGSFTYRRQTYQPGSPALREDFHFAVGNFLLDKVSFGVGATYSRFSHLPGTELSNYEGDAGLLWSPTETLSLGLTTYHLGRNKKVAAGYAATPEEWGAGIFWSPHPFLNVRVDYAQYYQDGIGKNGKGMYGMEGHLPLDLRWRLGRQDDGQLGRAYWTAGIGWDGPRLRFDYSFQTRVYGQNERIHGFDMWLHF
jgi:hypothetical protein